MNSTRPSWQESMIDAIYCQYCKKIIPSAKKCAGCRKVYYCTPDCQKQDWPNHKIGCKDLKQVDNICAPMHDVVLRSSSFMIPIWRALAYRVEKLTIPGADIIPLHYQITVHQIPQEPRPEMRNMYRVELAGEAYSCAVKLINEPMFDKPGMLILKFDYAVTVNGKLLKVSYFDCTTMDSLCLEKIDASKEISEHDEFQCVIDGNVCVFVIKAEEPGRVKCINCKWREDVKK